MFALFVVFACVVVGVRGCCWFVFGFVVECVMVVVSCMCLLVSACCCWCVIGVLFCVCACCCFGSPLFVDVLRLVLLWLFLFVVVA